MFKKRDGICSFSNLLTINFVSSKKIGVRMTAVGFISNKEREKSFSCITFPPFLKSFLLFKFTLKVMSN